MNTSVDIFVPDDSALIDTMPTTARRYNTVKKRKIVAGVDGYLISISLDHIFKKWPLSSNALKDTLQFIEEAINLLYWTDGARRYSVDVIDLPAGAYTIPILNAILDYMSIPLVAEDILDISDIESDRYAQRHDDEEDDEDDRMSSAQYHQMKENIRETKFKNRWNS